MTTDSSEPPKPLRISEDLREAIEPKPVTGELKDMRVAPTDEAETGRLRGDLVRRLGDVSSDGIVDTPPTREIAVGESIINRDGNAPWEIVNIISDEGGERVQLRGPDGKKAAFGLARLKKQLETEGEAWHW